MSSLLQMGHHSENLVGETDLEFFDGLILSPVNRTKNDFNSDISTFKGHGDFKIFFDTQLYFPRSQRGQLNTHSYFPQDIETADLSSKKWWIGLNNNVLNYLSDLDIDVVISPAFRPKKYTFDYFDLTVQVANDLYLKSGDGLHTFCSVIVDPSFFERDSDVLQLGSILSRFEGEGFYLIFDTDVEPRRELSDEKNLANVLKLIYELSLLKKKQVLVSNCSSDMILYKCAGADYCASGKFFNLRRFTTTRYEEPSGGGGQLPYWFEHSLMSFLREADLLRLIENGRLDLLGVRHSENHWSNEILNVLKEGQGKPWLALSWRQYLSWFSRTENELADSNAIVTVQKWLVDAEKNWLALEDDLILFEEPRNNGDWIRRWRISLNEFIKYYKSQ